MRDGDRPRPIVPGSVTAMVAGHGSGCASASAHAFVAAERVAALCPRAVRPRPRRSSGGSRFGAQARLPISTSRAMRAGTSSRPTGRATSPPDEKPTNGSGRVADQLSRRPRSSQARRHVGISCPVGRRGRSRSPAGRHQHLPSGAPVGSMLCTQRVQLPEPPQQQHWRRVLRSPAMPHQRARTAVASRCVGRCAAAPPPRPRPRRV